MTPNAIEKKLDSSTPLIEEQFDTFIKEVMGWTTIHNSEHPVPIAIHEGVRLIKRRYHPNQPTLPIWVIQCTSNDPHFKTQLFNELIKRDERFVIALAYPNTLVWQFGWVEKSDIEFTAALMPIGLHYMNQSWSQLLHSYNQTNHKSMNAFQRCVGVNQLERLILQRVKGWRKWALQILSKSHPTKTETEIVNTLSNPLYVQILILIILEQKGWLGIKSGQSWGTGSRSFLKEEWDRIQPRGDNFWMMVLRPLLLELNSNNTSIGRYAEIILPYLNLRALHANTIVESPIPNELFWDINNGLLSILYAFPVQLSPSASDHRNTLVLTEQTLRVLFEETIVRGGQKSSIGYHTPPKVAQLLAQQAMETHILQRLRGHTETMSVSSMEQDVQLWIRTGVATESIRTHKSALLQWLQACRICDPAMGTGALLVSIMDLIVEMQRPLNSLDDKFTPADIKYTLLQHNLFGVDTDENSLQVAHLTLWLSWVIDREQPKPFLNLENQLLHSNSLQDQPFEEPLQSNESLLPRVLPNNIDSPFASVILELRDGLLTAIKAYPQAIQFKKRLLEIQDTQWKLSLLHSKSPLTPSQMEHLKNSPEQYCIWAWRFPQVFIHEMPGFDIVLCNPPHSISSLNETDDTNETNSLPRSSLRTWYNNRNDVSYLFVHLGMKLSSNYGSVAILTSDGIAKSIGSQKLRVEIKNQAHLTHWVEFSDTKTLEDPSGQHTVMLCIGMDKSRQSEQYTYGYVFAPHESLYWGKNNTSLDYHSLKTESIFYGTQSTIQFIDRKSWGDIVDTIEQHSVLLSSLANVHQGLVTGANQTSDKVEEDASRHGLFVLQTKNPYDERAIGEIQTEDAHLLKPLGKNSNIRPFSVQFDDNQYVLYLHKDIPISPKSHPRIFNHVTPAQSMLQKRREVRSARIPWWALTWPRNKKIFSERSIVTPYRSTTVRFALNTKGLYYTSDCTMIVVDDSKIDRYFLLGFLNSTIFECWYRLKGKNRGVMLEFLASPLQQVPIPRISLETESTIATAVADLHSIDVGSSRWGAQVKMTKETIDQLLFKALNLSLAKQRQMYKFVQPFTN
jgi:hypothetical protein